MSESAWSEERVPRVVSTPEPEGAADQVADGACGLRAAITLGERLDLNESAAIEALARHSDVYQRGGRLVRLVGDEIRNLKPDALGALLSRVADFTRDKNGTLKP